MVKRSNAQLRNLLKRHYQLEVAELLDMEGYDSSNTKVIGPKGIFVLKRYPFTEAALELLQGENKILASLQGLDGMAFPSVVPCADGKPALVQDECIYRLLTFVEGSFLGDVEHTPKLLRSLGTFLGKMDQRTVGAYHAGIRAHQSQWDLQYFERNRKFLPKIALAKDRHLVEYFFMQYQEQVHPFAQELRKGIIHNDGNEWNVLTNGKVVTGIIDFGDMCHTWIINELAVALPYMMMGKEDPLNVALPIVQGYHEQFPLLEQELNLLYYLIAARLCTTVCNAAHAKSLKPDSAYVTVSEKPAWALLRKWLTINPLRARDRFRKAAGFSKFPTAPLGQQLARRNRSFSSSLSLSYRRPIPMVRSAFQYMYDAEGNTFLDAYNNIMLSGHCHPTVVQASQRTMARLNTNTRYLYNELLDYAEALLAKFPEPLNKVFLVNSGSAASDLAIRMAQYHTQQKKIMVMEHGYHGNTRLGIDISHYKYHQKGGTGKQRAIVEVPMPKAFGSGYADDGSAGRHFAKMALARMEQHKDQLAAFIAEPIIGCGGQVPLPKEYLEQLYPKIRAQGGICISDEVQVGFGRLGSHFWGFEMLNVVPDMVIIGKPMGNGHPIGAVITTDAIARSFEEGPEFFSSFGGNPVSCAVGQAVLQVIEEEQLQQHALDTGNHLKAQLGQLAKDFPELADIRGAGLFLGVEILNRQGQPDTARAAFIKNGLREKHILLSTDGPYDNVLKIKPPLSFSKENCDTLVLALKKLLKSK
ncbi:aminotransferase class III-fold pyridoxal phosphate-dependent enzyme [Maribacter sp. 2307ULW6-5]|uniref:aminotransferase class III-fold pyridoxal phosphate-dependent enzyme n=1 Tax=Maribacter sp. 2307ULW6-5 TaxID=3386275 RepID=UPI0039BD5AF5